MVIKHKDNFIFDTIENNEMQLQNSIYIFVIKIVENNSVDIYLQIWKYTRSFKDHVFKIKTEFMRKCGFFDSMSLTNGK